jgi:hypothetical protein
MLLRNGKARNNFVGEGINKCLFEERSHYGSEG